MFYCMFYFTCDRSFTCTCAVFVAGARLQSTAAYRRRFESAQRGDGSDAGVVWLEFKELRTTRDCRSATRDDRIRRSRLVVYVRGNNNTSTGTAPLPFAVFLSK